MMPTNGPCRPSIPHGWTSARIRDVAPLQRGFDLPISNIRPGRHPVVYSNGILQYHERAMVAGPGVITGRSGTIGKVQFVESDYWPHNTALWVKSFWDNDPKFVYYLYAHIDLSQLASGSGVPTLNRNDVHEHWVPVPPVPEQRAIGEALSDVDGLLGSLDAVIAKKRAVKEAVMQQLLTGKTRLPRFSEEWEVTTLGETADIKNGGTPDTRVAAYWNGSIPWCTPTDITKTTGKYLTTTERSITIAGMDSCAASLLPAGALLLCSRATIGEIRIASFPVCTNQGFKSLVCKEGISNQFLYYLIGTLTSKIAELAIGSTFLEIGKHALASIVVRLPKYEEQCAIATVLSDMDAEIDALERRRDKARALKEGMMQQLLTGRMRLATTE